MLFWSGGSLRCQTPYFRVQNLPEAGQGTHIQLLYQGHNGYVWVGTESGLFRFDGLEYQAFRVADSISNNQVSALYEDRRQRLWVGYEDGAICFLEPFGRLQPWEPEEGKPVVPITGFGEDASGCFWIATYGEGLYYWRQNRLYNINSDDGLGANDIYQLHLDSLGRAWVALDNGLDICFLGPHGEKKINHIGREQGLPDDIIRTIRPDDQENFWLGTYDRGFCYLHSRTGQVDLPAVDWPFGPIQTMVLFEDRELWIGTERDGLVKYNLQDHTLQVVSEIQGEKIGKVTNLLKDVEGNLWGISQNLGVFLANRRFSFIPPSLENIQAVLIDHTNKLWIGTQEGLFYFDRPTGQYLRVRADLPLNVLSLFEDQYHNLWIGTFGEGVFCLDETRSAVQHLDEADGLTNGSVLSIDGLGEQIWLATLGGVTEFNCRANIFSGASPVFRNYNQESGLGNNFIYQVFVDSRGRTWFGTDGEGISVLDQGRIINYPLADSIPLRTVYSITEDHRGHIWFSTAREGILEFDGESFYRLSVKEGLRNLAITSLITDEAGNILIVHPSGIDVLDPVTKHLIYYDQEVGIEKIDPNLNAVCKDQAGNIWVGAQSLVICYSVLKERVSIHPRTQIEGLSVFLDPVDFHRRSVFSHAENNLVFRYNGLWYTDPATVKFRYRLEGFNFNWVVSRDRQAVYPNLPPGKYVFQVSSTENEAFDQEPVVSYAFQIKRPIWQQPWFIVGATVLLAWLIWFLIRTRDRRLQRESLLKKEKVESQFEALKSQINPHFLFNSFNTLVSIIEENPQTAVEYVEKLSDFFRNILQYREKDLISVEEELELTKSFCFLLQKRFGENLLVAIGDGWNGAQIAPLTIQMLVENAVKHNVISAAKPLRLTIERQGNELKISNTLQLKLTREPSTGFGLQSIGKRYDLLTDRKIRIEKSKTHFTVYIPLIKTKES